MVSVRGKRNDQLKCSARQYLHTKTQLSDTYKVGFFLHETHSLPITKIGDHGGKLRFNRAGKRNPHINSAKVNSCCITECCCSIHTVNKDAFRNFYLDVFTEKFGISGRVSDWYYEAGGFESRPYYPD